jgi:hypothetical protein
MGVNIEVKDGETAEVKGPAMINVTSDVPGSVTIDGEPVMQPPPDIPLPDPDVAPVVVSLTPDTAVAGDADDITMVVGGTGFTPTSVIVFNGFDETTVFIDDTQVSTIVKPSLFTVPDEVPCSVRNGTEESEDELLFIFTEPAQRGAATKHREDHERRRPKAKHKKR